MYDGMWPVMHGVPPTPLRLAVSTGRASSAGVLGQKRWILKVHACALFRYFASNRVLRHTSRLLFTLCRIIDRPVNSNTDIERPVRDGRLDTIIYIRAR